jgi:hypothetical protein
MCCSILIKSVSITLIMLIKMVKRENGGKKSVEEKRGMGTVNLS